MIECRGRYLHTQRVFTGTDIFSESRMMQPDPVHSTTIVAEMDAQRVAGAYVKAMIGESFEVVRPSFFAEEGVWSFFIEQRFSDLDAPVTAGRISVNAQTGTVIPLSDDRIRDTQQCALVRAEHQRGHRMARGADGLVLPYQAKVKVNSYVSDTVAFFAGAKGHPLFVSGRPPIWRVETALHLPGYGTVSNLGTVDVNAISGKVVPLTDAEIKARQEKAHHAALRAKRAATPTG
jgi:hypothetical protein